MKLLSLLALFAVTLSVDAQCIINFGNAVPAASAYYAPPPANAYYAPAPSGCNGGGVQTFSAPQPYYAPPLQSYVPPPSYAPTSYNIPPQRAFIPPPVYGSQGFGIQAYDFRFPPRAIIPLALRVPVFNPFLRAFGFRHH